MSPERIILPEETDEILIAQHLARYRFAQTYVRDKIVVDIACGTGYGSAILAEGSPQNIIGIDPSPESIRIARETYSRPGIEFLRGSTDLLQEIDRVDLVVSFETIEHVAEPEKFLRDIRNSLRADGSRLIISTPVRHRGTLSDRPDNPYHVREWNLWEFHTFIETECRVLESLTQYEYRKRWFPGSRTTARSIARLVWPSDEREFGSYMVRSTPPNLPRWLCHEGYSVLVAEPRPPGR